MNVGTSATLARTNTLRGGTQFRSYSTWLNMHRKCTDPQAKAYTLYGGLGITICERWYDFRNFHADMGEQPDGMYLNRADRTLPYGPDNCRWSYFREQAQSTGMPRPSATAQCGDPRAHAPHHWRRPQGRTRLRCGGVA